MKYLNAHFNYFIHIDPQQPLFSRNESIDEHMVNGKWWNELYNLYEIITIVKIIPKLFKTTITTLKTKYPSISL